MKIPVSILLQQIGAESLIPTFEKEKMTTLQEIAQLVNRPHLLKVLIPTMALRLKFADLFTEVSGLELQVT